MTTAYTDSNAQLNAAAIGVLNQSQSAQAAARELVKSALGPTLASLAPSAPTAQNRSFQLTLTGPIPPATVDPISGILVPAGGYPTINQSQRGAAPTLATVIFDVAPGPRTNGFMQRVSYTQTARQSVQHTLGGFHYNEYGQSPGRLEVSAIVAWSDSPTADVQAFFQIMKLGKAGNPLAGSPPCVLRFIDTYLGLTLIITQEDCALDIDAEKPNMGMLRISASVLYDYNSGVPPTVLTTSSAQSTAAALTASALTALVNLI